MNAIEKGILADLQAPIRSLRISALERAIVLGNSPELLEALKARQVWEDGVECVLLLEWAVEAISEPIENASWGVVSGERFLLVDSQESLSKVYHAASGPKRLRILGHLPIDWIGSLAEWSFEEFQKETLPPVKAGLIRTFAAKWPRERLLGLESVLDGKMGFLVALAALEVLSLEAPSALTSRLPVLLESVDPRIRSLAVRALALIAPEEGKEHLEALFLCPDRYQKISGLRDCLSLPFPFLKPLLLKFISVEKDLELIKMAGPVLLGNPDPEMPFLLSGFIETSPPEKAEYLREVVAEICRLVEDAGMLGGAWEKYALQLQESLRRKSLMRLVQQLMHKVGAEEPQEAEEARAALARLANRPFVAELLEGALERPANATIHASIREILNKRAVPAKASELPAAERFMALPEAERCRFLAGLTIDDRDKAAGIIGGILSSGDDSRDILRAAVKAAKRLQIRGYWERCFQLANNSHDGLASEALEYMDSESSDRLLPFLGRFLKSPKVKVRAAALRILGKHDPLQGVSMLLTILRTAPPAEKAVAFKAMIHFDFVLVREELAGFLASPIGQDFLPDGVSLFQANPDSENLRILFRLERKVRSDSQAIVAAAREEIARNLVSLGLFTPEQMAQLRNSIEEQWKAAEASRASATPRLSKPPRALGYTTPDGSEGKTILESAASLLLPTIGVVGAILVLLVTARFFFVSPSKGNQAGKQPAGRIFSPPLFGKRNPSVSGAKVAPGENPGISGIGEATPKILTVTSRDRILPRFVVRPGER